MKNRTEQIRVVVADDLPELVDAVAKQLVFLEREIGTLEVGKRADIAVWDRNPYTIPSAELKNLACEMTIVEGKVVYLR